MLQVLQVLPCRAVGAPEPAKKQGIFYALNGFVSERDLRPSRLTTQKNTLRAAMSKEIERKFLVNGNAWRTLAQGVLYRQGYLCSAKERTVRVRTAGEKGFLTVKGITNGVTRSEFEYEIPFADADKMLSGLAEKPLIEKRRFKIPAGSLVWEIDEFLGENAGLIVAEIELPDEDAPFERPDWLGREVSNDPRYFNSNLVRHPFSQWQV